MLAWLLLFTHLAGGVFAPIGAVICETARGETRIILGGCCPANGAARVAPWLDAWNQAPCSSPCEDRPLPSRPAALPRAKVNGSDRPLLADHAPHPPAIAYDTTVRVVPMPKLILPTTTSELLGGIVLIV
jgi:hypothetical protein